jgi:hypothetical protein
MTDLAIELCWLCLRGVTQLPGEGGEVTISGKGVPSDAASTTDGLGTYWPFRGSTMTWGASAGCDGAG